MRNLGFVLMLIGFAGIGGYFDGTGRLGQAVIVFAVGVLIIMTERRTESESNGKRRSQAEN